MVINMIRDKPIKILIISKTNRETLEINKEYNTGQLKEIIT